MTPLRLCLPSPRLQMSAALGPLPRAMLARSPLAQKLGWDIDKLAEPAVLPGSVGTVGAGASIAEGPSTPVQLKLLRLDAQLGDLVGRLLCYDPARRITAAEVRCACCQSCSMMLSVRVPCRLASPPQRWQSLCG